MWLHKYKIEFYTEILFVLLLKSIDAFEKAKKRREISVTIEDTDRNKKRINWRKFSKL